MIFTTISFWIYFFVVYVLFLVIPTKYKSLFLLLASYYFYAHDNQTMLILILFLTFFVYVIGLLMAKINKSSIKEFLYYFAISILILNLAYFKYTLFFVSVLFDIGIVNEINQSVKNIYLPLAISFFTFEFIHYLTDIKRGDKPIKNYIEFSLFPAFFPTMIAGPIKRYQDFTSQLSLKKWDVTFDNFTKGLSLVVLGSFYKIAVSDNICTPIVNKIYDKALFESSYDIVIAMVAFSYQIFFDFQGYSLIAIGLALTFGIKIPINFNSPYLAINPSDFWRRWHITLSQWLRDYVFIPLGGSRASTVKIVRNLIITMLIGGIWHGAGYNFLIWGFLHGLALSYYRYIQIVKDKYSYLQNVLDMKIFQPLWLFSTFTFVTITWVFFRLDTFEKAKELLVSSIFGTKQFIHISGFEILSIVTISIFIFGWKFVQDFFEKYIDTTSIYISYLKPVFYYLLLIITLISVPEQFNPIFIYFRF